MMRNVGEAGQAVPGLLAAAITAGGGMVTDGRPLGVGISAGLGMALVIFVQVMRHLDRREAVQYCARCRRKIAHRRRVANDELAEMMEDLTTRLELTENHIRTMITTPTIRKNLLDTNQPEPDDDGPKGKPG